MARVTYSALVTELTGSIAGTTFQRNQSGCIARSRAYTPVNPSQQQSNRQLALIQLVALWPTLSTTNKDLWNALAAAHNKINDWGNYKKLSGYQWFLSYNLNAFTQGDPAWLYPDIYYLVDPVPTFTLQATHDYLRIHWPSPTSFPGNWAGIYATTPMRQSSIKLRKSTFLIWLWHTDNVSDIDITAYYESCFNIDWGNFYDNSEASIIVRMKNFTEDTGYVSPFTSALIQVG